MLDIRPPPQLLSSGGMLSRLLLLYWSVLDDILVVGIDLIAAVVWW